MSELVNEPSGGLGEALDELVLLEVLRQLRHDASVLVMLRLVSRRLRDLADLVLEEAFKQRWGVAAVVAAPPAAPMYASARHAAFVLCHQLVGRGDTLASLAVRHGTDVVELKRLNNLTTDGALASRSHLYVPVADAAATACGQRVAFVHDSHSKRRLVVVLRAGEELPSSLMGCSSSGSSPRQPPGSSQAFVVAKLAKVLERALRIDSSTAAFYVQQAGCDVRAAIEKFEEDRRWEKVMKRRGPRLRL